MTKVQSEGTAARGRLRPEFLEPNNVYGAIQVTSNVLLFAGLLVLAASVDSPWFILPIVFCIGIAQHRLFFPLHDCLHYTLFRARSANLFFGYLIAGLIGVTFKPFREQHLDHHRDFATPEDPGADDYQIRLESRWHLVRFLLAPLAGVTFLARSLNYVRRLGPPSVAVKSPTTDRGRRGDKAFQLGVLVAIQASLCALLTNGFTPGELWRYPIFEVLPNATVFLFLNRLRMFLEHASLDYSKSDYQTVTLPIARTIYALPWERFFLSGGNFNYHHEHHLYPVVPGCHLPKLHDELKATIDPDEIRRSYLMGLLEIWNNLGRKASRVVD